jgi:hypothetical protein
MIARKIIVSACIVKSWLKCSASMTVPFGTASCVRMSSAWTPPHMKKENAVIPYRTPIRLWSTVVIHDQTPVLAGLASVPATVAIFASSAG